MITSSLATKMLADQGARVLKVEPPGIGDVMRHIGTAKGGMSALFASCNHGKESVVLNLRNERGRALARDLALQCDILCHNFRPGVMERLGLAAEELMARKPELIYAGVSGFGTEGPLRDIPAYDHVIQAQAGFTGVQRVDASTPEFMRTLICDKVTAYTISQAILLALLRREKTGQGALLSVSMLDACMFFLWPDGMMNHTLLDDDITQVAPLSKTYTPIATKDGHIIVSAPYDTMWHSIFRVLGLEALSEDPRFTTMSARIQNMAALRAHLTPAYAQRTTDALIAQLRAADVPCAPCLQQEEAIRQEQVRVSGMVCEREHSAMGTMRVLAPPVKVDGTRQQAHANAPWLGKDTAKVLKEMGISEAALQTLRQAGDINPE